MFEKRFQFIVNELNSTLPREVKFVSRPFTTTKNLYDLLSSIHRLRQSGVLDMTHFGKRRRFYVASGKIVSIEPQPEDGTLFSKIMMEKADALKIPIDHLSTQALLDLSRSSFQEMLKILVLSVFLMPSTVCEFYMTSDFHKEIGVSAKAIMTDASRVILKAV